MFTLPNLLSCFRIGAVPVLIMAALQGNHNLFLWLLLATLFSDLFDGWLARRLHQDSPFGATLDSVADFCVYLSLPLCIWRLWPDTVRQEAAFIIAAVSSYLVPVAFGFLRFRRLTSYHTWAAKLSAVLLGITVMILLFGWSPWPFRLSVPIFILAALEDMAITVILPQWQPDIPSLGEAVRVRTEATEVEAKGKEQPPK